MSATALFTPAFTLPQSPAAAVALILALLAATYLILNMVAPVRARRREGGAEPEESADATPEESDEHAPALMPEAAAETPAPAMREPDLRIQAMLVRGVPLAVGDTASRVMRAFRPGEGERLPLIERRPDGAAARVIRAYRTGDRLVVLVLEREEADEPLRLTALDIEES